MTLDTRRFSALAVLALALGCTTATSTPAPAPAPAATPVAAAAPAPAVAPVLAVADDDVTLEGSFVWARDDGERTGDLTAILTPSGSSEWSVAFHFIWEDEPHVYLGDASGSLVSGLLEGSAENDDEDHKISFRFKGEFEDGTFNGVHSYVDDDGSLKEVGTLTLSHTE